MPGRLGDRIRLQHILDAIEEVKSFTKGISAEDFMDSTMIISACIRQLEVIGEASNRLTDELMNQNPQVNWSQIIGLRNLLIHQYFGVDEMLLWEIIQQDLPEFEEKVKAILKAF
ncbi:MAG: DUF86 domain-containing protein [Saprospiraceae bacterium]